MEMKEWITGRNPVYECLRAERRDFFRLLINKRTSIKGRIEDIIKLARRKRISVETVDKTISELSKFFQAMLSPIKLSEAGIGEDQHQVIVDQMNKNNVSGVHHELSKEDREAIVTLMM